MAKFLETEGTSAAINHILRHAEKKVVIITPYVQFAKLVLERLEDAANRGVQINIVFGKDYPKQLILDQVKDLPNIKVFFLDNLHAKCYYNEHDMVLTSMNLYEFSAKNNREMGVSISKVEDAQLYAEAVKEAESIIGRSKEIQLYVPFGKPQAYKQLYIPKASKSFMHEAAFPKYSSTAADTKNDTHAYCIRCKNSLPHNPEYPLCRDCHTSWAKYQHKNFEEKYCHTCGKEHETSYAAPQCKECYSKAKKR